MLRKIEGRRRRGQQRMRWLDMPLVCLKLERSVTLEPTVPDLVVDGARGLPLSRGTESSAQRNVTGFGNPSPSRPVSSF